MKKFSVERLSFTNLTELPGSWTSEDYKALLKKMDYANPEEISEGELKEMCLMSLTDMEPAKSAEVVLEYLLEDTLSSSQIENLGHQMLTEKLWEENPELSMHQAFFEATQLLHAAYNGKFPKTEAVQFQVSVSNEEAESLAIFDQNPEAPLLRLLTAGMADNVLIKRLYGEQLKGTTFEDAANIIWQLKTVSKEKNTLILDVVSSAYWLNDFKFVDTYTADTHADAEVVEES
ncbi:MAG TPA: hypothetical protein VF691_03625 [Cytophagaceae bacterium]|jgi:hypothetical protein